MKLTNLKLDYDSNTLGQQMKQEIEDILKENNKPNIDEIAKSFYTDLDKYKFHFIFGKCHDTDKVGAYDFPISCFKTNKNWYVLVNYIDHMYDRGLMTELDGPFTYEQAKVCLLAERMHLPKLANQAILHSHEYQLNLNRYHDLEELDKYFGIDNFLINFAKFIKIDLAKSHKLYATNDEVHYCYYGYMNKQLCKIDEVLKYSKKPYIYSWSQTPVDGQYNVIGKTVTKFRRHYDHLDTAQTVFALKVKKIIFDPIKRKLVKSNDETKLELYLQWKYLNIAYEYEKVFGRKITFDLFCKIYRLNIGATKFKQIKTTNKNIKLTMEIIDLLDKQIDKTSDNDKLKWMKTQYKIALNDLQNSQSISIELKDMDRQYLESYSDYENPLLDKISELNKSLGLINDETPVSAAPTTSLDHLIGFFKKLKPFANQDSDSKEKGLAIKNLIDKRLKEHGTSLRQLSKDSGDEYIFGEYKMTINCLGIFKLKNKWFIYTADERQNEWFNGPYTDCSIIYAFAMTAGISDWFEDYKFDTQEKEIFVNNHFNSLIDLKKYLASKEKKDD